VEAFGKEAAATNVVRKAMELPLELQHKHLLLRLSMVLRTIYLPMTRCKRLPSACGKPGPAWWVTPSRPSPCSNISRSSYAWVGVFPLHHTHCIRSARAARPSSVSLTQLALQNAPAQLSPFDGPHLPAIEQMWDAVKSVDPGLCAPHKSLAEARKDYALRSLQTTVANHVAVTELM
jgi:hypothetical protein